MPKKNTLKANLAANNVKELGQVFTPETIVEQMLLLRKNTGEVLEPACGKGAFSVKIKACVAVEIDKKICPTYALNEDFFDYSINQKFDTIIGNPPYVKFKDISEATKEKLDMKLFDKRTNLYLFFIYKCIKQLKARGELIFITPREFLKATSAIKLNNFIYEQGTITDLVELGDKAIFRNYSPNCIIFRFEKDNFTRVTNKVQKFENINGQLTFLDNAYKVPFKQLFMVKVGAVSGQDAIFTSEKGNVEFVCSETRVTGKTRKMFYNLEHEALAPYKKELLARKIKKFGEKNWFEWGRGYYISKKPRLYVNCKTRIKQPFFFNKCKNYDGSVLAIFPKTRGNTKKMLKMLNEVNWEELGFVCDGRYIFAQKALENCGLPDSFNIFLEEKTKKTIDF